MNSNADPNLKTTIKEGLFLVKGRIGEREVGLFLLDTGASHLIFDTRIAQDLNLPTPGETEDPASKQRIKLGKLDSLGIGPVTLLQTPFAVLDLSSLNAALGERLAGILGCPFFARLVVEFDNKNGSVSCYDPRRYQLRGGEWQDLTLNNNRPAVHARLEGNLDGLFWLDTGKSLTVSFLPDFIQQHNLLSNRQVIRAKNLRLDAETEELEGKIAWFELTGVRFENPTVRFKVPDSAGSRKREGIAGFIGQGILREFKIVFNYPESKIAFLRQ